MWISVFWCRIGWFTGLLILWVCVSVTLFPCVCAHIQHWLHWIESKWNESNNVETRKQFSVILKVYRLQWDVLCLVCLIFIGNWFKSVSAFMRNSWSSSNQQPRDNRINNNQQFNSVQFNYLNFVCCSWSRHIEAEQGEIPREKKIEETNKQQCNDSKRQEREKINTSTRATVKII